MKKRILLLKAAVAAACCFLVFSPVQVLAQADTVNLTVAEQSKKGLI